MLFRVFLLTSAIALVGLLGLAGSVGCGEGGFPPDAVTSDAEATGTVSLAFSLTDVQSGPINCEQVGANTVFLQLKSRTAATGAAVSLSCANSSGTSQPIAIGTYDVSIELHGFNVTLATAPNQNGVIIRAGADTPLSPVMFKVDANGALTFSLAAPPATSNCKAPAQGGAGITTTTITLVHPDGSCAPVTFARTRGTTTLSTYTVNCSAPMVAGCFENDEVFTVSSMASGPYLIHIRGRVAALDCWENNDSLQVPPSGQTLTTTLNLAFQRATGCVQP
jgi:hypothetical protein